jgi:hypothetical protein
MADVLRVGQRVEVQRNLNRQAGTIIEVKASRLTKLTKYRVLLDEHGLIIETASAWLLPEFLQPAHLPDGEDESASKEEQR